MPVTVNLAHTSGVKASIIEAVNVFIAILVAGFLFHQEKITSRKITGCILGFAGVVLINLNGMNFQFNLAGEGAIPIFRMPDLFRQAEVPKEARQIPDS